MENKGGDILWCILNLPGTTDKIHTRKAAASCAGETHGFRRNSVRRNAGRRQECRGRLDVANSLYKPYLCHMLRLDFPSITKQETQASYTHGLRVTAITYDSQFSKIFSVRTKNASYVSVAKHLTPSIKD